MKLTFGTIGSASALLLGFLFLERTVSALSPDPRLLSLVPPDSQIVAGGTAPSRPGQGLHFLLIARANHIDFDDFVALVGTDPSHGIREVVFTATASDPAGNSQQHSLLASGHFDSTRIFASTGASSKMSRYHGIPILQVDPFERERAFFPNKRLLAFIDSRVAIFGTAPSVQQEIDRYLTAATPDASITQRLEPLRSTDETWCLISSVALESDILRMMEKLDPAFGELIQNSHSIQFGTRMGRQFEVEYVVNAAPLSDAEDISNSQIPIDNAPPGRWSFSSRTVAIPTNALRGIVKISKSRYDKWLGEFAAH